MEESETDRVRKRPGMYLGGVDEECLHRLAEEILSNAMDEAIEGHATAIDVHLMDDGSLLISDNGRGIPIEIHPKLNKSVLEAVFTHLHLRPIDGEKIRARTGPFITISAHVVNALSDWLWVEVARDNRLYRMQFTHGKPTTKLERKGEVKNRRGTTVCFHPDPQIFGNAVLRPATLYMMAQSKAQSYGGVKITWKCGLAVSDGETPTEGKFHFPNKF